MKTLQPLIDKLQHIATYRSIQSVLSWDQETQLPDGAISFRAKQQALLSGMTHDLFTSDEFNRCLSDFVDLGSGSILNDNLSSKEKALLREVFSDWKRAKSIPSDFMSDYSQLCSEATHVWQQARERSDYSLFKAKLSQLIDMNKRMAAYIDDSKSPYDVLLNDYEPGITAAHITRLFEPLKDVSVNLLKRIQTSSVTLPNFASTAFDTNKQWQFTLDILKDMHFDFSRGRQDKSTHPFTIDVHPSDVRVTTRLSETDPFEAITSTIHECGHALYEQGFLESYFGTPLGQSISLGVHESQSRLWENHVGRSLAFWEGQFDRFKTYFPEQLATFSPEDIYKMVNRVEAGLIRVEADEVTYNLHVLIRFEIEKAIFSEAVSLDDLPELWNSKYEQYLGVRPSNDAEGLLQDIHWSGGSFGYFPTYTIGTLMAAQMFEAIEADLGSLDEAMRARQLEGLKAWLNKNVHECGRQYSALDLIKRCCGTEFSSDAYLRYLSAKYEDLYQLSD